MFDTKKESARICEVAEIIYEAEHEIDDKAKIYLMTWSPDPKQIPDCDFINQHLWCAQYVHTYLQGCRSGCACVETTQMGNPHYHLWYQICPDFTVEQLRIRWIKVLQKIGNVKITGKVRYYRKNAWYSTRNALFYYKKDSLQEQLMTPCNPITKDSVLPEIDYSQYSWFFQIRGRATAKSMLERTSQVKDLEEFYKKSI